MSATSGLFSRDSRLELDGVMRSLDSPAIIWLDAHWNGPAPAGGGEDDECPLLEEIRVVNRSPFQNVVLVDDARLFTSPPPPPHKPDQWPDLWAVLSALMAAPDRYIAICEDVIIAVPIDAKEIVVRYCRDVNLRAWEEYGKATSASRVRNGLNLILEEILVRVAEAGRMARYVLSRIR